jgi:hypothetical protein
MPRNVYTDTFYELILLKLENQQAFTISLVKYVVSIESHFLEYLYMLPTFDTFFLCHAGDCNESYP